MIELKSKENIFRIHLEYPIFFYDSECGVCSRLVLFFLRHDQTRNIRFASLQGKTAETILRSCLKAHLNTAIFVDEGEIYQQSSAILRALGYLPFPWCFFENLLLIPVSVRDWIYQHFAKRRLLISKQLKVCHLPTQTESLLFLP